MSSGLKSGGPLILLRVHRGQLAKAVLVVPKERCLLSLAAARRVCASPCDGEAFWWKALRQLLGHHYVAGAKYRSYSFGRIMRSNEGAEACPKRLGTPDV